VGWGTETDTGIMSASRPPDDPAQGAGSSSLDPSFRTAQTAESPASAIAPPGTRSVLAGFIAEACCSYVPLDYADVTALYHPNHAGIPPSHHRQILRVVRPGIEIPFITQCVKAIWQSEPQP
jgi:hypothetical protein